MHSTSARFAAHSDDRLAPGPTSYDSLTSTLRGPRGKPLPQPDVPESSLSSSAAAPALLALPAAPGASSSSGSRRHLHPRRRRRRPVSRVEAAAESAATSTSFGVAGRGDASHWNWVKSGSRPPRGISKLEQKRQRALKKKRIKLHKAKADGKENRGNAVLAAVTAVEGSNPKAKRRFRKPRKDPSLFNRKPLDVESFIAAHCHVGHSYPGSFGRTARPSSTKGSFSFGSRPKQVYKRIPAPGQYGDPNPTFAPAGSQRAKGTSNTKWVEDVKRHGSRKLDKAVAELEVPSVGASMYAARGEGALAGGGNSSSSSSSSSAPSSARGRRGGGENWIREEDERMAAAMRARLRAAGLMTAEGEKASSASSSATAIKKSKISAKNKGVSSLRDRMKRMRKVSASASFGTPGLGGTGRRFAKDFLDVSSPGPGQYGDVDSFSDRAAKPAVRRPRPSSAAANLGSRSASASALLLQSSSTTAMRPDSGTNRGFSTFGASARGDLLEL